MLSSVFASNALLVYGFSSCPGFRRRGEGGLASALALTAVSALASGLFWCLRVLLLAPLGLESLDLLFFVLIAVPLLKFLGSSAAASMRQPVSRLGVASNDLVVSCLVFGLALVYGRGGYGLAEALVASASAGAGYWMANVLLDSLRERLELSAVPAAFRGQPAMLISAGLMAMAFMGIDRALVRNLAG